MLKYQISWKPPSESRTVGCGQTDGEQRGQTDGHADVTNLTDPCRNFANAPKTEKGQLNYFYTPTERT
jgi:hypothetical protein